VVAIPLFAAGVITTLLQFDITASPPAKTASNDLLEGTLASFQNESDRWPQQVSSLILFTIGFVALIGLVALLRNAARRDDPWMLLGTPRGRRRGRHRSGGPALVPRCQAHTLFSPTWRGLTLAIALVMAVGVIAMVAEVDILSDVFTAVGAAILTPIWAVATARGLPAAAREVLG
jgi:hypothetical protein